ncbi:MAG TPA: dihydrodipicolinate synthase family protein, partial [Aggregatilineaceae bacterium]|nr:dihydrodipicolinate synthase family protein [Aggregatilineaceae bacterium]
VGLTMNVAPRLAVDLYEAFQAGDHERARALQSALSTLREGLAHFGTYPVWVKEALTLMGLPAGPARRPILPLNDAQRGELQALLQSVGVLQ